MAEAKNCQGSSQGDRCHEVYRRLSEGRGPSIVLKVLLAFVVPVVVFVGAVAVFERLLGEGTGGKLEMAVSFAAAVSVSFAVILIIKAVNKRFSKG